MKTLAHPRDREELLHRLQGLRPDNLRRWGRMSTHQMVCHLSDAFRVALGELPASRRINLVTRTVVKWFALGPLPWPPGVPTRPEIDQVRGAGTKPAAFAADVARVEALLERFATHPNLDREPHPLFGAMSQSDWLRWGYLHVDHHLRQFSA